MAWKLEGTYFMVSLSGEGLAPAFAAARARLGLIAALFGLAAVVWWSTADRMGGMERRPRRRPRRAWLVPRRVGRDDGRDDVPVGRADGRALRTDGAGPLAGGAVRLRRRLPRHLDRRGPARLRPVRGRARAARRES